MNTIKKDYIIVGQGIAGSVLAATLMMEGKSVIVIDNRHSEASSCVAGGGVNPITGQRFVKSWKSEELQAEMRKTYAAIWALADPNSGLFSDNCDKKKGSFYTEKPILRVLHAAQQHNDWQARSAWESWQGYIGSQDGLDYALFETTFNDVFSVAEI